MTSNRFAVFTGPGRVELREEPLPELGRGEVLVEIRACGLCTMEQRLWKGRQNDYPIAAGHETAGVVAAVHSEGVLGIVGRPARGDRLSRSLPAMRPPAGEATRICAPASWPVGNRTSSGGSADWPTMRSCRRGSCSRCPAIARSTRSPCANRWRASSTAWTRPAAIWRRCAGDGLRHDGLFAFALGPACAGRACWLAIPIPSGGGWPSSTGPARLSSPAKWPRAFDRAARGAPTRSLFRFGSGSAAEAASAVRAGGRVVYYASFPAGRDPGIDASRLHHEEIDRWPDREGRRLTIGNKRAGWLPRGLIDVGAVDFRPLSVGRIYRGARAGDQRAGVRCESIVHPLTVTPAGAIAGER